MQRPINPSAKLSEGMMSFWNPRAPMMAYDTFLEPSVPFLGISDENERRAVETRVEEVEKIARECSRMPLGISLLLLFLLHPRLIHASQLQLKMK